MMAMKAILAAVLRTFKVYSDYKKVADIEVKAELVIKPVDGFRVAFEHRCAPEIK